jgi:hypothetical protein
MKARELVTNEQVEMGMRQAGFNETQIYWTNETGPSNAFESHKEGMEAAATLEIYNGVKEYLEGHALEHGEIPSQQTITKILAKLMDYALSDDSIVDVFSAGVLYYKAYEIEAAALCGWRLTNLYDGGGEYHLNLLDGMLTVDKLINQKLVAVREEL